MRPLRAANENRRIDTRMLRECADLANRLNSITERMPRNWIDSTASKCLEDPGFCFARDWFPQILVESAFSNRQCEIITEYPAKEEFKLLIERFFGELDGKFKISNFEPEPLSLFFVAWKFTISW